MRRAAILLIGNELLSGAVQDTNAAYLIGRLRGLGVTLARLVVVPDERAAIAQEVRRLSPLVDDLITSGGVGPTHDDVTMEAIAEAFSLPLKMEPMLEALVRARFGERVTDAHLRMAQIPDGATLIEGGEIRWPVTRVENVYVLPGVPQLFRAKFETIAHRLRDAPFFGRALYLNADEGEIARPLAELEQSHGVSVGSYPTFDRGADHRVKITVEARTAEAVDGAVEALARTLGRAVLRVEAPLGRTPTLPPLG